MAKENNQKQVSSTPDFNKLELEILKFWEENKIFEKSLEQNKDREPYIFYDGPPFATGLPHYGHILASTIKDAIPRYHTMKGKYVRRRWGWDCHGLPIENIVEKILKISGKKQIEEIGVEKFNQTCRENVLKFVEEWGKTIKRLGRFVDFENSYKTMDTSYQESVWWALKQLWEKKLVYEDRKVLLYCSRCETPISNFEVAMDNSYRDITETSVFVKFRVLPKQRITDNLTNEKTYMLAWTTTPWTLPGNTALNIGPDIRYVLVEQNSERYILAKGRLSVLEGEFDTIAEFPARAIEGLKYEPLYSFFSDIAKDQPQSYTKEQQERLHKIYFADFVTTQDGTGVVHNAAMYGEDDYKLAKEKDLPRVDMLGPKGQYLPCAPESLRGLFFKDADKVVLEELLQKGLIYKTLEFTHSYPHCHRCGTPLFYNALPAWFINIQKVKSALAENNEAINWYPKFLKHGRFLQGIQSAPDWNISRNRYWATALPFWKCNSGTCKNAVCIGSIGELMEKSTNFAEVYPVVSSFMGSLQADKADKSANYNSVVQSIDLHKPFIDRIKLKCEKCGGEMSRVPEVVDCWVESGSMPFAELHYPFEHNGESSLEDFKNRFPADFVAEYIGQTRAWFYVMHAMSVLLFEKAPFKNVSVTGNILAEDGSKMSKSRDNFPDPLILIEKYGVDALRFYLLTNPVMSGDDINFSEKSVQEINRKLSLILYNVWSFYRVYEPRTNAGLTRTNAAAKHILDRWILSLLSQVNKQVTEYLDNYDTVRAGKVLLDFINDLSTWYLRRSRDRIKGNNEEAKQALGILGFVIAQTCKMLAPFMPFISDLLYKDLTGEESVHLSLWENNLPGLDEEILKKMEAVREAAAIGLSLRKEKSLPVRQPLASLALELTEKGELGEEYLKILLEELNVKKADKGLLDKNLRGTGVVVAPGVNTIKNFCLDINLTEELKQEGLARELERQVQDLRKKSGLKIGELVDVYYNTQDARVENILLSLFDRKKTFVNQISKSLEVEVDFETQSVVDTKAIWLGIVKI